MFILGFFALEGNPLLYMRNCITTVYYSERRDYERAKKKLQWICCRLYPFGVMDEINERIDNFFVDVAQIGWTMYIYVFVLFAFFYIFFPHLFYCFAILFLTNVPFGHASFMMCR